MERKGHHDVKVKMSSVDVVRTDSELNPVVGTGVFLASFNMVGEEVTAVVRIRFDTRFAPTSNGWEFVDGQMIYEKYEVNIPRFRCVTKRLVNTQC